MRWWRSPYNLVLGLVIAPLFEQSLRQSLIMSNGHYMIFFNRPISLWLLVVKPHVEPATLRTH